MFRIRTRKRWFFISLLITGITHAYASDGGFYVDNFTYHGKVVHPFCIAELLNQNDGVPRYGQQINLAKCSLSTLKVYTNKQRWGWYSVEQKLGGQDGPTTYTGYQAVGNDVDNTHLFALSTEQSNGGTGFFSTILLVDKSGDKLTVIDTLAHGDKADGGIGSAMDTAGGDAFEYSQYLTPQRLIQAPLKHKNKQVKLSTFPSDGVGEAHYRFTYKTGAITLEGIQLEQRNDLKQTLSDRDASYQEKCFARLFLKQYKKSPYMNAKQAQNFSERFIEQCI